MKLILLLIIASSVGLLAGCIVEGGRFSPESHFSFPNSTVVPLGQVKATRSRWSVLTPSLSGDDALELMREALAQKAGADLIIDYVLDTTTTIFPPFIYKTDMVFEGTAVKMTIGRQELQSILNQANYRPFKKSLP
jgi:hypothetical protein